ncbi:MAG: cohesin domain-containing protein [Patescibacteria group bacterium]
MRFAKLPTSILVLLASAFLLAKPADAATLSLSAATTSLTVGKTTTVSIVVRSTDQAINASQGKLNFPTDKLQVTGVSKGSLFSYWTTEPSYSNSNGTVSFGGGLPNPGYKGSGRSVLTVTFKAKAAGKATITYASGAVLANDGLGTNILTGYGSTTLSIAAATPSTPTPETPAEPTTPSVVAPVVKSSTHPNSNAWYNNNDPVFTWTRPTGVQGVSFVFDQSATTTPDEAFDDNNGSGTYNDLTDGAWYFHLRAKSAVGWSTTAHVRVRIDTQAPAAFTPSVSSVQDAATPTYRLQFETTDSGSGIADYTLALDTQDFTRVTSPHLVETQKSGIHQFTLRAADQAGNVREAIGQFNVEGSPAPRLTSVPKKLTLFADFTVEGLTVQGDTVALLIDGKELARFSSDTYRIDSAPGVFIPDGLTLWRYSFKPFLAPGSHNLTAVAMNRQGLESPASVPATFHTLGSTVQVLGFLVPSGGLILFLLGIIAALIMLLAVLYQRFRHWQRAESFDLSTAEDQINDEIDRLQTSLEKDIVGAIRSSVTERSMQAATHEQIRKDITQVRQRIDDLVDKQVKKLKKKKKGK